MMTRYTFAVALGMGRAMGTWQMFTLAKADYEKTLEAAGEDPEARAAALEGLHDKWAGETLELARKNGGIYNKAAQFVASLQAGAGDKVIPKQFIETLRVLTDKAPHQPMEVVEPLFEAEFGGRRRTDLFEAMEETPIAAASLAQVHVATTKGDTPRRVAVKLQYPHLRDQLASDFSVFQMLGSQIKPGGFDLSWVVSDFRQSLTMELDFRGEAENSRITAANLAHRPYVRVPEVVDELTTSRVLTMEFVDDMVHCNDADKLRAAGFDPMEVAGLLSDTFAEMLFCTGFVHGDPHGGNVYCRRGAGGATEIVVLDHGLYHRIDDALRRELCEYVVACAMRDGPTMERLGLRFAGPLHRYFPLLLSPWFIFGARLSADEVQAAREKRMPPGVDLKELGQFLVNMHDQAGENNILGVLHSMGYTRGMLQDVGFPEKLRLQSYVRFASLGLNQQAPGQYDDSLSARAHQRWCLLQVEALSLLVALLGGAVQLARSRVGFALLHLVAALLLSLLALQLWVWRGSIRVLATDLVFSPL